METNTIIPVRPEETPIMEEWHIWLDIYIYNKRYEKYFHPMDWFAQSQYILPIRTCSFCFVIDPVKQTVSLCYYLKSTVTTTNYFTIFLQTIDVINSYLFSFGSITNITFLLTNNYLSYQQFVKKIV